MDKDKKPKLKLIQGGADPSDPEDRKYRDVLPPKEMVQGLQELKRVKNMPRAAPNIKWGEDYKKWPLRQRLRYAERLAATMNYAADLLQQERNKLLDLAKRQEAMMKQFQKRLEQADQMLQGRLTDDNEERQEILEDLVFLKSQVKQLARQVRSLGGEVKPVYLPSALKEKKRREAEAAAKKAEEEAASAD